jgi:succinyl-CoA synthetase alpha subunit
MAILVGPETRVVVQGITGNQGSFHTGQMLAYGTRIVAGTSPSRVGGREQGVPIFATVREAVEKEGANASVVFVPARFATDAAFEAIDAGVEVLVLVPEHLPVQDTMEVLAFADPTRSGSFPPARARWAFRPTTSTSLGPSALWRVPARCPTKSPPPLATAV